MKDTGPSTQILMACLGDASRFRLVQALVNGARCVTDLATEVGLSQSWPTRHLQALERRRVVRGTRDGKRVMYRLRHEEPVLRPLLAWALRARGGSDARRALGPRPHRPGARLAGRPAADSPAITRVGENGPQRPTRDTGGGSRPAGPELERAAPAPEQRSPVPRRGGGSDIEDYLL